MQAQALSIYALSEMAASKGNPSVITEALRHLEDPRFSGFFLICSQFIVYLCSMDRDVDVVMTRACLLSMVKRDEQALDQLNLAIAMFSDFAPALIEKAKVMVSKGDWDQAMDAIQRVLFNDPTNIQVLPSLSVMIPEKSIIGKSGRDSRESCETFELRRACQ